MKLYKISKFILICFVLDIVDKRYIALMVALVGGLWKKKKKTVQFISTEAENKHL